jgi:hypothetical protein
MNGMQTKSEEVRDGGGAVASTRGRVRSPTEKTSPMGRFFGSAARLDSWRGRWATAANLTSFIRFYSGDPSLRSGCMSKGDTARGFSAHTIAKKTPATHEEWPESD